MTRGAQLTPQANDSEANDARSANDGEAQ